ncbi:hypothetical protein QJQ45_027272, partial [Haematococcus lacustris]
ARLERERKGEALPEHSFDSNCITPGTPFMDRLGKHLRFFIRRKMSEDPLWQAPTIIFSGHDVPGEGEHKIMEFIRWEKRSPDFAPNQRHCLYGLDADLIMLSLVTHEPHFCLLREVVSYTGGNRGQPAREALENPSAENFVLFHISLLREYLELEFKNVVLPFPLDVERIVDDFVLFCMLIGNDFLPALPTLDINEGALNTIMSLYKELLPTLGGYLTLAGQSASLPFPHHSRAGELDRRRLEVLLVRLGALEQAVLEERAKDAEFMEGKRARRAAAGGGGGNGGMPAWQPNRGGRGQGAGASAAASSALTSRQAVGPGGAPGPGFGGRGAGRGVRLLTPSLAAQMAALGLNNGESEPADEQTAQAAQGAGDVLDEEEVPCPVASSPLLGALEGDAEGEEEAALPLPSAEPTMMSREARQLMLGGQGARGLQLWKERWYTEKLGARSPEERRAVVDSYLQGLHWVLEYYYRGVASWNWYYPYYFAPMASDMVQLDTVEVSFTQGTAFRPYEQLLGVLPAASCALLPGPYQHLMTNPASPIIDFYPTQFQLSFALLCFATCWYLLQFEIDSEGKRAAWEGVVKVPFVDEERLLAAARSVGPSQLSSDELARNELGGILVFTALDDSQEKEFCKTTMAQVRPELRMAGINVLGTASRKESLLLGLRDLRAALGGRTINTGDIAKSLLNTRCYVNWPYLQEARIDRVSDAKEIWYATGHAHQAKTWQSQEAAKWSADAGQIVSSLLIKHGLEVGACDVICHVKVCKGFVKNLDGTINKLYSTDEVKFPVQCVVRLRPPGPPAGTPGAIPASFAEDIAVEPALKPGDRCIFLGKTHYGCLATLLPELGTGLTRTGKTAKPTGAQNTFRIAVQPLGPPADPDPMARAARRAASTHAPRYLHSSEVARKLGVNPRVLGRISSNVWITEGEDRYDVGLAVRSPAKGMCVPGYVAPTEDGRGWAYSTAMVPILQEYKVQAAWLWSALERSNSDDGGFGPGQMRVAEMLPGLSPDERKAKVTAAVKWVKSCPLASRPLVPSHVQLMTEEGVRALQLAKPFTVKVAVQGGEFELGDRVVSVLKAGVPSFGLYGAVIGVYDDVVEVVFDTDFPGGSSLGGRLLANSRAGAVVPKDLLLNLSRPQTLLLNKAVSGFSGFTAQASAASTSRPQSAAAAAAAGAAIARAAGPSAAAAPGYPGANGSSSMYHPQQQRPHSIPAQHQGQHQGQQKQLHAPKAMGAFTGGSGVAAASHGLPRKSEEGKNETHLPGSKLSERSMGGTVMPGGAVQRLTASESAVPRSPPPPPPSAALLARAMQQAHGSGGGSRGAASSRAGQPGGRPEPPAPAPPPPYGDALQQLMSKLNKGYEQVVQQQQQQQQLQQQQVQQQRVQRMEQQVPQMQQQQQQPYHQFHPMRVPPPPSSAATHPPHQGQGWEAAGGGEGAREQALVQETAPPPLAGRPAGRSGGRGVRVRPRT